MKPYGFYPVFTRRIGKPHGLIQVLAHLPFILDTDASAFALGGVLSQKVDGVERVIAMRAIRLASQK